MNQYLETLQRGAAAVRAALVRVAPDSLLVGGAVAISWGAWMIYPPSGFIVGGLLSISGGVLLIRGGQ